MTVAIKATPADLPAGEARNMLAEISMRLMQRRAAHVPLRCDCSGRALPYGRASAWGPFLGARL
jgi:hypothetical protein